MNTYYHIIQHAIGDENLFRDDGNFHFFIGKIQKLVLPSTSFLAYCLLPNHIHFLIKSENSKTSFKGLSNLLTPMRNPITNYLVEKEDYLLNNLKGENYSPV